MKDWDKEDVADASDGEAVSGSESEGEGEGEEIGAW